MRAKEQFSYAVGNVLNDLYSQLVFSFLIIFLMKVVKLSASQAGMMVLIAQISDASISLISGYLGDNVNVPFLSNKIGRRKSWHLVATMLMAIGVPLWFNKCFLCDGRDESWLPLVYYGFFSALTGGCYSMVEINHLAFATNAVDKASEIASLTALKTLFNFLSGIYAYVVAWVLLGQDNGDKLGPDNLTHFTYLSWITTGTGVLFATIFYIGTQEVNSPVRKSTTFMDLGIHPAKKRRPKRMKDWLRDPNLYKVAIVYTCSRLVQGTVYTYLPLFLTERLLFAKEAIAYFPLVLLISASLSSTLCEKLNKKIGSKWSYLLAASLVIGGAVWSYFQTPSTGQMTYAPVVLIGFGMSVMYVMALAFITELIGENKETSGAVISIITVIARLASGGLVIGIQEFYPDKGIDTNEAISDYVQHVFVMVPGILTLVGFLLVLIFQSSVLACKTNAPDEDIEAKGQEDRCPSAFVVSQFSSKNTGASTVSQSVNQNTTMAFIHSCPVDTKL